MLPIRDDVVCGHTFFMCPARRVTFTEPVQAEQQGGGVTLNLYSVNFGDSKTGNITTMLKLAIFVTCVFMVFAEGMDKTSIETGINTLRVMRRLKGMQKRGLMDMTSSDRQKKDANQRICNACSYSGNNSSCVYVDAVCSHSEICADIWRIEGSPKNYNGCINPALCQMIEDSKDSTYIRVECCNQDLCNW